MSPSKVHATFNKGYVPSRETGPALHRPPAFAQAVMPPRRCGGIPIFARLSAPWRRRHATRHRCRRAGWRHKERFQKKWLPLFRFGNVTAKDVSAQRSMAPPACDQAPMPPAQVGDIGVAELDELLAGGTRTGTRGAHDDDALAAVGGRQGAGAIGLGVTHEFRKRRADGALDGAGVGDFAEAADVDKDGVLVAEELDGGIARDGFDTGAGGRGRP